MMSDTKPRPSPCIGVCAVSARAGFCIGCGRKLAEIGGWTGFSEEQRDTIRALLPERLKTLRDTPTA